MIEFKAGETLTINRGGDLGGLNDSRVEAAASYHFDITGKTSATINIQGGGSGAGAGSISYKFDTSDMPSTVVPSPYLGLPLYAANVVQKIVIAQSASEDVRRADRIMLDGRAVDGPRVLGILANDDFVARNYTFDGVAGESYYLLPDQLGGEFHELNIFIKGLNGGRERIVIEHWREGDLGIHFLRPRARPGSQIRRTTARASRQKVRRLSFRVRQRASRSR